MSDRTQNVVDLYNLTSSERLAYLEKLREEGLVRLVLPGVYVSVDSGSDGASDRKE